MKALSISCKHFHELTERDSLSICVKYTCRNTQGGIKNMDNVEMLQDELNNLESRIDEVIDEMINHYGKFLNINDYFSSDKYKRVLVNRYSSLNKEKLDLVSKINRVNY
ncbi:MAG: hypothetical protein WCR53_07635 [Bacteroidaceae bacterium]